jgi:tungstate transport system substrate-binding protein
MTLDRRDFVTLGGLAALAGCSSDAKRAEPVEPIEPPLEPGIVRIASVKTAVEGTLLPELIKVFERDQPLRVRLTTGSDVYAQARAGKVDLVISHYGHKDAEQFVLDGLGEWPRTIFSNQMAIVGPPNDPAGVRGMTDAGAAFAKIAATKSKFLVNNLDGVRYVVEILWNSAGRPDRTGWVIDGGASRDEAIHQASEQGAYTIWGLTPFLRATAASAVALEPLVLDDPLLQRMLVSILVRPGGSRRANSTGANAFQSFLLAPATQAFIRTVRYPGKDAIAWVPAGRHNRTAVLPKPR